MQSLEKLIERIRRIEALYHRTDVEGERAAAGHARQLVLEELRRQQAEDPATEYKFSLPDGWSRRLFMALARRHNLQPYRYRGQRYTTVMLRASKAFVDKTLWPEYLELSEVLRAHLDDVTNRVIDDCFGSDVNGEATEVRRPPALAAPK